MYDRPEAYDIVFDIDTEAECDFLEAIHRRHGGSSGRRVLEPACGTGRLLRALTRRGWETTGFDHSEGMLGYARETIRSLAEPIHLEKARFDAFAFEGRFDLAHCLISSIQHVKSEEEAAGHLRLMADHLESGGLYVLALHLVDRPELIVESETFHAERDGVSVTCVLGGEEPDPVNRRQRIHARLHVEKADGARQRHESSWWFRTWTLEQFMSLLAGEPRFELVALHDYGLDPDLHYELEDDLVDLIVVLRRR